MTIDCFRTGNSQPFNQAFTKLSFLRV
ncbi:hypothetical protein BDI4_670071 [Burkholderia diffusa]|nr:hypothetical protein BDI4_670071 [Burkholderia diffusa]